MTHQPPPPLTARDLEHLEVERSTWTHQGAKAAWVMERFGCTLTTHYSRVQRLLTHPQAAAWDPQLIDRLNRIANTRAAHRSARQLEEFHTA